MSCEPWLNMLNAIISSIMYSSRFHCPHIEARRLRRCLPA